MVLNNYKRKISNISKITDNNTQDKIIFELINTIFA